jgi:hypothetical protein
MIIQVIFPYESYKGFIENAQAHMEHGLRYYCDHKGYGIERKEGTFTLDLGDKEFTEDNKYWLLHYLYGAGYEDVKVTRLTSIHVSCEQQDECLAPNKARLVHTTITIDGVDEEVQQLLEELAKKPGYKVTMR